MDIITVTCVDDLKELLRQCRSINRFVSKPTTHFIIIQDNALTFDQWYSLIGHYYTKHKLILLPNDSNLKDFGGWVQSLQLKYNVAKHVTSDYYLILDSKNFFIKETNLDQWPVNEGSGKRIIDGWPNVFINFFSEKYHLPIPKNISENITPYKVKTETSKKIIATVDFYETIMEFYQMHPDKSPSGSVIYDFFSNDINFVEDPSCVPFITMWKNGLPISENFIDNINNNLNIKIKN